MTPLDRQDTHMYFATLSVNSGRWMVTQPEEDVHEFG